MSFLMRVQLPDRPGSLALLAETLGVMNADIQSVDVIESDIAGTVTDDIVVALPPGTLADALITAAESVEGVLVDSIRPYAGTVDRRGQVAMLAAVADLKNDPKAALDALVTVIPKSLSANWAIVISVDGPALRVAASDSAPEDDGSSPQSIPVASARAIDPEDEPWVPESWALLDTALAAAPLAGTSMILVLGRVGGPSFLGAEIKHLGNLGRIIGAVLA